MATTKQVNANRTNSTHSTGPSTASGKAACSQNGLKHGLASSQLIIPGESEDAFNALLAQLLTHHAPENITETLLVQDMAKYHWLADRALRLQNLALAQISGPLDQIPPALALLIRYHTANQRAFAQSLTALNTLRKIRLAEIGSASKIAAQAEKQDAQDAATLEKLLREKAHADFLSFIAPPSDAQMNAAGHFRNPETGAWDYTDVK